MQEFRPCSKSTKVSLPQICSRSSSRVTSWPARVASRTRTLAGWGGRLISTPAFRSSPLLGSSSKSPKRSSAGSKLPVTTDCSPTDDYTGNRQSCHHVCRRATAREGNELADHPEVTGESRILHCFSGLLGATHCSMSCGDRGGTHWRVISDAARVVHGGAPNVGVVPESP